MKMCPRQVEALAVGALESRSGIHVKHGGTHLWSQPLRKLREDHFSPEAGDQSR